MYSADVKIQVKIRNQQIAILCDVAYKVAVIGGKSATVGMGYAAYFVIRTHLDLLSIPQSGEKMSKRLGGIMGCKHKTALWHLNGLPYGGSNIGSTV